MNKKILVIGAARSGLAATRLLLNHGYSVVLTDNRDPEAIAKEFPMIEQDLKKLVNKKNQSLELVFGEQINPERLNEFEFIVTSPGVPETVPIIQEADKAGVQILAEPELAYRFSKTPFIAITGTNGKTTTTTLTGEIFKNSGRETKVVGNIGDAVSNHVDKTDENAIFVTEIGSFQLSRCYDFKPEGSLILNITPDHLDRHKTMQNYINAKARIYQSQDENDFVILNLDDKNTKNLAQNSPVKKYYISLKQEVTNGAYLKDGQCYLKINNKTIPLISQEEIAIKGLHNVQNVLGASLLTYLAGVDLNVIQQTLKEFKGVEHRQEVVGEFNGIKYINDSKGTNTDAAIIAIDAMDRPTILIAGGYDKKEDYTKFAKKIKEKVKQVILLGVTKDDIKNSLENEDYHNYILTESFEEAVATAKENAQNGDVVLLSPACASWDMFDNYEQRGELFKQLVR